MSQCSRFLIHIFSLVLPSTSELTCLPETRAFSGSFFSGFGSGSGKVGIGMKTGLRGFTSSDYLFEIFSGLEQFSQVSRKSAGYPRAFVCVSDSMGLGFMLIQNFRVSGREGTQDFKNPRQAALLMAKRQPAFMQLAPGYFLQTLCSLHPPPPKLNFNWVKDQILTTFLHFNFQRCSSKAYVKCSLIFHMMMRHRMTIDDDHNPDRRQKQIKLTYQCCWMNED